MRRKQFRSEDIVRQGKPKPCPECPKYKTCRKPCDEVERWISQDHVGLNTRVTLLQDMDLPQSYNSFLDRAANRQENIDMVKPDRELAADTWKFLLKLNLPEKSLEFAELYYHKGMTLARAAAELGVSAQAAHDRHKKLKSDVKERLERIEIWKQIRDEYLSLEEPTNVDLIVMLFYGMVYTRHQVAEEMGMTYTYVNAVLRDFVIENLDKLHSNEHHT